MAVKEKAPAAKTRAAKVAPVAANDQGELTLAELAGGILSRTVRPRTADIRRLAEAVLAGAAAPVAGGKKSAKDARKGKADEGRKDSGKKKNKAKAPEAKKGAKTEDGKKLAKIPGAKTKK